MKKRQKMWSILLCCGLLLSNAPQTVLAQETPEGDVTAWEEGTEGEAAEGKVTDEEEARFLQELAVGGSVTVSTPEQFEQALNNSSVTEIVVSKRITLCGTAESSDYSISPVMIRGNVTIRGNGSGILTLRSPIQLTGDHVVFQDIEMNFISSGALGSVPHREIFLAGHTLTLDNVSCYTKGSDGSLGGFGGDEAELLPTVYAGGYRNTSVAAGAGLTIQNSNDKTTIQAIYAGHDGGKDNKVPYTGSMNIKMDSRAVVRDGVFAGASQAAVNITVTGQNANSCRTKYFEGNDNTTITFEDISVNRIPVNGGKIVLTNGAVFEPVAKDQAVLDGIEVQTGTTLNLASMPGTVIKGDFKGGGTLVLDKDDSLTINGEVSGNTTFKTWSGSLAGAGSLTDGKAYITCTSKKITGNIQLDGSYQDYSFEEKDGVWTAKNNMPADQRVFGSFEVVSAPAFVDYDVVKNESLSNDTIEPSQIFVTETKDENGEVYIPEIYVTVLRKEDTGKPNETNWGTDIWVEELGNWNANGNFEGKYYISFGRKPDDPGVVSEKIKPGEYVAYFTLEEIADGTVENIQQKAIGSAEFTIYKKDGQASKEIQAEHVSAVADQSYTGKEIKPSVQVTVDGVALAEGTDYILKYENNKNVTSDSSMAKVIVEGIGGYHGTVERSFRIVKGETETKGALTVEKKEYEFGEIVKFYFTAAPKKESGKKRTTRSAQTNTADFYYGNTLLGSADVVNGKAVLNYDTTKCQIPIGAADITVDFGGNAQLKAANFTEKGLFNLKKKKLGQADIASISLKDFEYDGKTRETEITGITWTDPSIQNLTFEGRAELASVDAGAYQKADVISLTFTGEESKWYDVTALAGGISNVAVNPDVVIRKAKSEETLIKTLVLDKAGSCTVDFDKEIVPDGFEVVSALEGDPGEYGSLISNVSVTKTKVTFDVAGKEEKGTIHVMLTFKNHEDLHLVIHVIKTSKTIVDPVFQIPDMEYTGSGYDAWSVEGYSKDQVTVTYYNLDTGKELGSSAPVSAGNYSVTLRLDTGTEFAEKTVKFTIEKRQTVLKALDRKIKTGEAAPNLDSPVEGVDYEFVSGRPNQGESIGVIKMVYAQTPDTSQIGTCEIQIGIVGNINENYSVETKNAQLEVTAEETPEPPEQPKKYRITVNGGHADVQSAKAGDPVTITAEAPEGQQFVRWNTKSAGVSFANAESAVTTFVMPANDVEITAEMKETEIPEPPKKYRITVNGGHADVQNAKAGDPVTITAEAPEGQRFVRWNTKSAGVSFANAESAKTTFAMPANDVEITAEFAADGSSQGGTGNPPKPGTPGNPGSPGAPGTPDSNHGNGDKADKTPGDKTTGGKQPSGIPTTGDNSTFVWTGAAFVLSLAAIAALLFFGRRR